MTPGPKTPWGKALAKKLPPNMRADADWVQRCKDAEKAGHGIAFRGTNGLVYGMVVEGDRIVLKNRTLPLPGARATVDSVGSLQREFAPAKLLAFGILGATKRVENHEVYFAVDAGTDGVAWSVRGADQAKARKFALKLNTLAARAAAPAVAPPSATEPQTDIPDQIRKLDQLRADGILTDEEFEAKKTDLLRRL